MTAALILAAFTLTFTLIWWATTRQWELGATAGLIMGALFAIPHIKERDK